MRFIVIAVIGSFFVFYTDRFLTAPRTPNPSKET